MNADGLLNTAEKLQMLSTSCHNENYLDSELTAKEIEWI